MPLVGNMQSLQWPFYAARRTFGSVFAARSAAFQTTAWAGFHHNRALVKHLQNRTLWLAMLIGGVNLKLYVNLYSVMGFRLVAEPYSPPIGIASQIFVCYLAGTLRSKLTANWNPRFSAIPGMMLGALISMAGMLIALFEAIPAMLAGLILISFGAFSPTLWLTLGSAKSHKANATASALYLVHYHIGGSLGGYTCCTVGNTVVGKWSPSAGWGFTSSCLSLVSA